MMQKKQEKNLVEAKIDTLAKAVARGFAGVDKKFAAVAEDTENLRTELKTDIKELKTELKADIKKVDDRVVSVESKLGAIDNRIDNESFARKDLEVRVRKVLPSLPRSTERA
ncbi:MAG TPA: hypothetical protein VJ043_03800 [Candidatus Paceibacterota bacterium]|nr:hypothetical protein [Candidatus Paceibacterota bacterium]